MSGRLLTVNKAAPRGTRVERPSYDFGSSFRIVTVASQAELDDAITVVDGRSLEERTLRVNVAEGAVEAHRVELQGPSLPICMLLLLYVQVVAVGCFVMLFSSMLMLFCVRLLVIASKISSALCLGFSV